MAERRSWFDLSAADARAIFDRYVAGHTGRVAALLGLVRARGGPVDRLDFTRASLGPLWAWVMATEPPRPASDAEMRAAGPPWWYEFHDQLGQQIGPNLARVVTLVAAYVAETIIRNRPGSTWVIDGDRNSGDFRQPQLRVAGGGEFLPDGVVLVMANHWARNMLVSNDRLLDLYDVRAGPEPAAVSADPGSAAPAAPWSMERGALGAFDTVVSFDEETAHGEDARIDRLVAALVREPGIERAVREDREVVLVAARRLDDAHLAARIGRIWDSLR